MQTGRDTKHMEEERLEPETEESAPAAEVPEEAPAEERNAEQSTLRQELENVRGRVRELERERLLLTQGVAEDDLDYYLFKIGKLVTEEKDFPATAREFLKKQRTRTAANRSTGASLSGSPARSDSPSETMNRLIRGG